VRLARGFNFWRCMSMVHQSIWYCCSVTDTHESGVQEHGSLGSPILKAISNAGPYRHGICSVKLCLMDRLQCKPDEQSAMVHRSRHSWFA
jgi:hypothetical protein